MLKRPQSRPLVFAFSLAAVLVLILSACGASGAPTTTTPSSGTPVKGGTWINDLYEEPDSLIPNASQETFAYMVQYGLYAPLVYSTPAGVMTAGIATVVPTVANGGVSADLKTVTFHLRSGLVWSDGVALDARDVDFTWKTESNPKFPVFNNIAVADIASAVVSSDNLSITFTLKNPLVSFVSQWSDTGLLAAHHYASMDPASITKSPDNLNPSVTNGPFMMSESKPGDHYTIARNPKYYLASQNLPYLDKVVFKITPDQNTILKDLQAGSIDSSWFLNVANALAYAKLSSYTLVADPNSYSWEALWFNFHNKVLGNNPEVRKAIAMATDQQTLIDVARRGLGGKRCQDHPQVQVPGYTASLTCPQLNPDLAGANTLLKQNGWVMGSDGVYAKNGQRLEFQYSTTANNLWRSDDQLINKANFAKIGIKVNIQNYPASTFFGSILPAGKPGVFDIAEFAESGAIDPDNASVFQCGSPGNPAFYCNPKMDALLKQEQSTGDSAARQKAFDAINQLLVTDFPMVLEFSAPDVAIHKKGTHNYSPSAIGIGETINIWEWWCDGGVCPA